MKNKKSLKQKTIELMFGSKIRGLVRTYRKDVIVECFNMLNDESYKYFTDVNIHSDVAYFLDVVKNKLLTIDALQEDSSNKVVENEKA